MPRPPWEIREAHPPLTGPVRHRVRAAVRDPGTPWPLGPVVDGVGSGLLGRRALVLRLIVRPTDVGAAW
ncbi:hypothetical protein [Streptomyces sp. DSM 15324]|uniref:hypothetical protein n=1 Tax=Streptomyces sp. DSM 15324 TaxID=1739111 RepID=UPI00131D5AE6|nr:hypothetical protein [Streptomyces sp. DSM 15324]